MDGNFFMAVEIMPARKYLSAEVLGHDGRRSSDTIVLDLDTGNNSGTIQFGKSRNEPTRQCVFERAPLIANFDENDQLISIDILDVRLSLTPEIVNENSQPRISND
jgi:hypothetical protein